MSQVFFVFFFSTLPSNPTLTVNRCPPILTPNTLSKHAPGGYLNCLKITNEQLLIFILLILLLCSFAINDVICKNYLWKDRTHLRNDTHTFAGNLVHLLLVNIFTEDRNIEIRYQDVIMKNKESSL